MTPAHNARQTAEHLPWKALVNEIAAVLRDNSVGVAPRLVQPLPGGGSLFVMPALDRQVAITKLITFTPANAGTNKPAIQGDVVVFDIATGERRLLLDGPTVTGRRTAAVSVLAAQQLAPNLDGPLLIIGAGVQGKAHLEAFAAILAIKECWIASRRLESAQALVHHAQSMDLQARVVSDLGAALAACPLVVTCTPAHSIVLDWQSSAPPRADCLISAVGAFTPHMAELSPALCRHFANHGSIFVDTADATHEAGDLLQAGLDVTQYQTLAQVLREGRPQRTGPVLFKSCGWAGWDLAAARVALAPPQALGSVTPT